MTRRAGEKKLVSGGGTKTVQLLLPDGGGGPGRLQGDSVRISKERGIGRRVGGLI